MHATTEELSNGVDLAVASVNHKTPETMHAMTGKSINGFDLPVASPTHKTLVWNSVSRWLPPRNADCDYWWKETGPILATMLSEAGYTIEEQYEGMLFHYHLVVPRLGSCPSPSSYKSPLLHNGVPVAYSWKWNTAAGVPDVRYTVEAMGELTGTTEDPLSQVATTEILTQLESMVPSVDLTWFNDFLTVLYNDKDAHTAKSVSKPTSSMLLAFELLKKGLGVKTYFTPTNPGATGTSNLEAWEKAIRGVTKGSASLDQLMHFLNTDAEGGLLRPWLLAIDCVKPSKSRIKLYLRTPHTSFDSVRTIMTMGGKIQGLNIDHALSELDELIKLVLGLDKNFPSSDEVPTYPSSDGSNGHSDRAALWSGYTYYFDIAPGASMPDIKFYLPLRLYAKSDLQIAKGLTRWMTLHGRGQFTKNYMRVLDNLATHRDLDAGAGIQTYIACMVQGESLTITTYMSPEHNRAPAELLD